jgi:uncharacterized protein with HEPN domain
MPKRDDMLLLDDIYEAGSKILRYTKGVDFDAFSKNDEKIDAVIRNFEIIGEASRNLSSVFRDQHTAVPWRDIISYRNFLIHEYFGISLKAIWNVLQDDLPPLMEFAATMLAKPDGQ